MLSFQAHEHIINIRGACVIPKSIGRVVSIVSIWASLKNPLCGVGITTSVEQTNGFVFMFYSSGVANSRETYHKATGRDSSIILHVSELKKQTDSQKGRDLDYECGTISQTKQSISTLMKHVVVLNLSSHWGNLSQIQSNKHI